MSVRIAKIPEIKEGIVFSDPIMKKGWGGQYRIELEAKEWFMHYDSSEVDNITAFALKLGPEVFCSRITATQDEDGDYQLQYPDYFEVKQVTLAVFSDWFYCGTMEHWKKARKNGALYTGGPGFFGRLLVFTVKEWPTPVGFLITGSVSSKAAHEDELFDYFLDSFQAQELAKKSA